MQNSDYLVRQGQLLLSQDSDIRILTLEQARDAVIRGFTSGAFSAVIPLLPYITAGS
jgi:uncharacterized protein (DUF2062 family)